MEMILIVRCDTELAVAQNRQIVPGTYVLGFSQPSASTGSAGLFSVGVALCGKSKNAEIDLRESVSEVEGSAVSPCPGERYSVTDYLFATPR